MLDHHFTFQKLTLLLFTILLIGACNVNNSENQPGPEPYIFELSPLAQEVIPEANRFGVSFYLEAAKTRPDSNLMLSPLSASVALTMLLNGADGETYTQIRDMLGYPAHLEQDGINQVYQELVTQLYAADPKVNISVANSVFYHYLFEVKPGFTESMREEFDALVQSLDFSDPASVDVMNQWASDNTNGLIDKIIEELHPDDVMILMNALYFKGSWSARFSESDTQDRPFTLQDGSVIEVPTMTGEVNARYALGDGYQAIELPYGRRNFSMVIILPDDHDYASFSEDFTADDWLQTTELLGSNDHWSLTEIFMPRFKIETSDFFLNSTLQEMGMQDAFIPHQADLSRISDAPIFVGYVKQDSFVEVNEEGTEAAAVTTIAIRFESAGPDPMPEIISIDRPFLFGIRERTTNTLLFMGQVMQPGQ